MLPMLLVLGALAIAVSLINILLLRGAIKET
jgi:hypothetical protein